jgi:predicted nucleotidyltransferase
MSKQAESDVADLGETVGRFLQELVRIGQESFGEQLRSVVLFGSGAEGRLRATSDVNVIIVLSAFERARVDRVREFMQAAGAAIRLRAMFLLASEIDAAAQAFGVKFHDIVQRHRVLYGPNPFAHLRIDRGAEVLRLKQVLLNLTLRLREQYVTRSLREEQLLPVIAEAVGPLRAAAAALLTLEGGAPDSPKEALERFASALPQKDWIELVERLSVLRRESTLASGEAAALLFRLIDLAELLRARAGTLS